MIYNLKIKNNERIEIDIKKYNRKNKNYNLELFLDNFKQLPVSLCFFKNRASFFISSNLIFLKKYEGLSFTFSEQILQYFLIYENVLLSVNGIFYHLICDKKINDEILYNNTLFLYKDFSLEYYFHLEESIFKKKFYEQI